MTPTAAPAADAVISLELRGELDLQRTLAPLAHGRGDPTIRLSPSRAILAFRMPSGAATLELTLTGAATLRARAWGAGAEAALAGVRRLVGEDDEPSALVPHHPVVASLMRRNRGLRLPASGRVWDALIPSVLEQKVTGPEARAAYRGLIRRHGDPAPGPFGLRLTPEPAIVAGLPYFALHPMGVERRRAEVLRRAAAHARRLGSGGSAAEIGALLRRLPGIGEWTVAEVLRVTHGDPDAVSVGDFHLKHLVAWALAGEPRASDERLLELLEPYRGQRGRVQRLLEVSGLRAPRYGPRLAPRSIAGI